MAYERANIAAMTGYVPGEQPSDPSVVKLNTNENPHPPTDEVLAALGRVGAEQLRRYPNPTAARFRETAAQLHGVAPQNIIATNGGDELLRLVIATFVEPRAVIGVDEPSYSLYPVLAAAHEAKVFRVELNDDWSLPDDYAAQMNQVHAQVAFIVNPHAPSGRLAGVAELDRVAAGLQGVLVVDEAYVDFVDPALAHDAVELVRRHDNVILLRSLSKGYALAGLRLGYGIGAAGLIEPMLTKTKDSYNTDAISQALAAAALEDRRAAAWTWAAVRSERARLTEALRGMGLHVPDSQSNFVLARPPGGDAEPVYRALKQRGILVRYFDAERLNDKLRITIGTAEQNDALLGALSELV
jgi:histidinol-phosphate aminotransferase